MRSLAPRQLWYKAVGNWILAEHPQGFNAAVLDFLRYAVPHAARHGNKTGFSYSPAMRVQVRTVLGRTSAELKRENLVGKRTMEALGTFLRAHGAKLADGWDSP